MSGSCLRLMWQASPRLFLNKYTSLRAWFCPGTVRGVLDCPKDGTVLGVILVGCMVVVVAAKGSGPLETFDVYGASTVQI